MKTLSDSICFLLAWELLGRLRASHLLNWIVEHETILTLNALRELDGVRQPFWASSSPLPIDVTLVNPSEVSREEITRSDLSTREFQIRAMKHSLFLPVSSSSASQHVVLWCSLLLMAVSLPPSFPSADMP